MQSAAAVTIERTTLQSNIAGTEGGVILSRGTNVMITRTLLQSNTLTSGTFGAAIFGFDSPNGIQAFDAVTRQTTTLMPSALNTVILN